MGARKMQEKTALERHEMLKVKKNASSSSDILKANKEATAAASLRRFKRVPGGSEIWMDHWREMMAKAAADEAAEAARPVKKRKKVLKHRVPKAVIDLMMASPFRSVEDLTPAQLAKHSSGFRDLYPLTTFVDAKLRDYEQALIRQYNAQGYAEDESEVTDREEDATAAPEN